MTGDYQNSDTGRNSDAKRPGFAKELGRRIEVLANLFETRNSAAEVAGVTTEQLRRYIAGRSKPPLEVMARLARNQGVSLDWLASGDGDMRVRPPTIQTLVNQAISESTRYHLFSSPDQPTDLAGDFAMIPHFDIQASAGPGAFSDRENVLDYMAFREDWIRRELRVDPSKLVLIRAVGDSMEPTIRSGDLLLVDTGIVQFVDDAIYVVVLDEAVMVKRIQRFMGGAVTVRSDNTAYVEQTLSPEEAESVSVAGRVRWIGRLI